MAKARNSESGRKAKKGAADHGVPPVPGSAIRRDDGGFRSVGQMTKSEAIRKLVALARRAGLDYAGFQYVTGEARKRLALSRQQKGRALPRLLTRREVAAFFAAVDEATDLQHQVMLRVLAYAGLRVAELVAIERANVDLNELTIRVVQGKGSKDRTVLIPESFRLALQAFMERQPGRRYLFTTRRGTAFTTRRVQQLVAGYAKTAALEGVHPHLFRHFALTELTRSGLTDAQIQIISGHASKKSLETYQHLALADVRDAYQAALKGWGV